MDHEALQLGLAQTWIAVRWQLPVIVFVFCFGACVGSFLNVVIYRLPAGMSVITPPSRCPVCGVRLRFFRENLPILGWLFIRGKCRACGVKVSPQYMIVELLMALAFTALYVTLYVVGRNTPWLGGIGGAFWRLNNVVSSWPSFVALCFLLAGLVAMTVIDARTFTIPIEVPLFVTISGFVAAALQPLLVSTRNFWPFIGTDWTWSLAAFGGMAGVVLGVFLLRTGRWRYSFADYEEYLEEGEEIADYPHARREMKLEILFVAPIVLGMVLGGLLGSRFGGPPPTFVQSMGGSFLGYLVGGGLIWAIRILGTLAFGREAMGMGDVHLLAAIGAVLGWFEPILIFFAAPFIALAWTAGAAIFAKVRRRTSSHLPYGPHLAVATLVVILTRPAHLAGWNLLFPPWITMPTPGLVVAPRTPPPKPAPTPAPTNSAPSPSGTP